MTNNERIYMELGQLISEVKHLLELEKAKKREKKARGECFNIFSTMQMERNEVHTHSAIIAELLNPQGSHGSGDVYLQLFLQSIPELQTVEIDTSTANVEVEYRIPVPKGSKPMGRIDILIYSNKQAIIIENKIDAEDQLKQLFRYRKFAEEEYANHQILYLTKKGTSASEESLNGMTKEDYVQISYKKHIKDWLLACIEKSATKPLLRETLVQYYNLILKITKQNMENSIKEKLVDLYKQDGNTETLFWIFEHHEP